MSAGRVGERNSLIWRQEVGVDISMSMGWGIHFSQGELERWLEGEIFETSVYEGLEELLAVHPALTYEYAGNAWTGNDMGYTVYAKDTYKEFDMGRSAEAGVYRAPKALVSLEARYQLDAVSKTITGKHLPIEWLVTVGVS